MILGNKPKDGERAEPGKFYWWLALGRHGSNRMYTEGWRVFEIRWLHFPDDFIEGGYVKPHGLGFSFWLPFDRA